MNCRKFETIINDLARVPLMDAATKESGLAHAETCARCASRLADERALTQGLRALSAGALTHEAPARVEAALLAAFRTNAGAPANTGAQVSAPAPSAVVVPMPQSTRRTWPWPVGAAAAAAAAILFAVTMSLFRLQPQPVSQPPQQQAEVATTTQTFGTMQADNAQPGPQPAQANVLPVGNGTQRPQRLATSSESVSLRRPAHRARQVYDSNSTPRMLNAGSSSARETEIATDFMPLTYDGGAMSLDSGRVVRVELPRSALISMGLPMNLERAGEPLKADVLLGDDGVARAIRFVR